MNYWSLIKLVRVISVSVILLFILSNSDLRAQHNGGGHYDPDSLTNVTISGITIVDSTTFQIMFFLDENNDGIADYYLNFGPNWYRPDSSVATRPADGDLITVVGGLHNDFSWPEKTVVVFEINKEFWRNPYFAEWNNMGYHNHQMGNHHNSMIGYGFGWQHDTTITTELSGIALVDTTFYMNNYFLDINNDSIPDYNLNFGPIWYEAESDVLRPIHGDNINIVGGEIETSMNIPMIIVYELNGLAWRDSATVGKHFGGGWVHVGISDSLQFHSPFDYEDRMTIRSGWNSQGGHHGGGMHNYDSLFCQILEINSQNIPNIQNMDIMAGYEIQMFNENGGSIMRNGDMMGGHMEFASNVGYQLHYTDKQLEHYRADENSIEVKYWDDQLNDWVDVNALLNTESNTVTFDNNVVSNFVVLELSKVTTVEKSDELTPENITLSQNYPNPFNPSTVINFTINLETNVTLNIYNLLGERVAQLVNKKMGIGSYNVSFNASKLPSGIYFYELNANLLSIVKKMSLVK